MQCKKCDSRNLGVIKTGCHNKVVCLECYAFVKFIGKKELANLKLLRELKELQDKKERKQTVINLMK